MRLAVFGIGSQSLDAQRRRAALLQVVAGVVLAAVAEVLQLVETSLGGGADGGDVAVLQAAEQVHRRIGHATLAARARHDRQ